jgi:hypothetical protein
MSENILFQQSLYYQELLAAQYKVSGLVNHAPTKGELREGFIKDLLCKRINGLEFKRGILAIGDWQSPEIDFIWLLPCAEESPFKVYRAEECRLFMEIKSEAKKDDFGHLDEYARKIKELCPNATIQVGMFCYNTQVSRRYLVKDLGFGYDRNLKSFKAYNKNFDQYPFVDFVYSLGLKSKPEQPFFIKRGIAGENTLFTNEPVIDYFMRLFKE